jgi:hypothetical protein
MFMDEASLQSELDQVTSELAAARIQYASIGARIAGLEAQRLALTRALEQGQRETSGIQTIAPRYRTDAIVAVLEASGAEMSIQDVITGLADLGRPDETADNVGVDLAYLAERDRVRRVRRGIYAALPNLPPSPPARSSGADRSTRSRPLLRRQQGGSR